MHRQNLLGLLSHYVERYPEESSIIERFQGFVGQNPDCFQRELTIGHVTGSAWLVNSSASHVLLTHHRKLERWLQLGGHADGDSDVLRVALREASEESGIEVINPISTEIFDVDIHPIPARGEEPAHFHYDVRFALQAAHDSIVTSDESHELRWVETGQVHYFAPDLTRMASKWRKR